VCCREALKLNEGFRDARFLLSQGLQSVGSKAEARAELETLLSQHPGFAAGSADLGLLLADTGEYSAAISHLRRAAEADASSSVVWSRLGECALELGLFDEAREAFITARRLSPRSPEIAVNLGRAYAGLGRHSDAIDAFADAMFLDPSYANAYFNAGDVLYRLGYYPKAAEALHAGLRLDPDNAGGFLVLGNCYFKTEDLEAATVAYEAAIARKPDYTEALHNLTAVREIRAESAAAA
jgi:cytochrome c-type biogenesis protein CcmH/NrfG